MKIVIVTVCVISIILLVSLVVGTCAFLAALL